MNPRRRLSLLLWAVSLHSLGVGLGLILTTPEAMQNYGFGFCGERFFPVQGGVFHIVMALAYALAARDPGRHFSLVVLTICAKSMALVFLLSYFFFVARIQTVLFSGIADGLMGLVVFLAYSSFRKAEL